MNKDVSDHCAFVFVVCGDKENIDELNISIRCLKHFTKYPILVVTDLSRNKEKIEHNHIVDVPTMREFTDHQASIFLKTSLFEILDKNRTYCYLDTDVIAVRENVDDIFRHKQGIISFASDIVDLRRFSWYAVKCNCLEENEKKKKMLLQSIAFYESTFDKLITGWKKIHHYISAKKLKLKELIITWDSTYKQTDPDVLEKKKQLESLIPVWERDHKITDKGLLRKKHQLEGYIYAWETKYKDHALYVENLIKEWEAKHKITDPVLVAKREKLLTLLTMDRSKIKSYLKRNISLVMNFKWDKEHNIWYDRSGNKLYDEYNEFDNYFERLGYVWNSTEGIWYTLDGEIFFDKKNEFWTYYHNLGFTWDPGEEIWYDLDGHKLIDKKNEFEPYFLRHGFIWDEEKKIWFDTGGVIIKDVENEFIPFFKRNGFRWEEESGKWFDDDGLDIFDDENYYGFRNFIKRNLQVFDDYKKTATPGKPAPDEKSIETDDETEITDITGKDILNRIQAGADEGNETPSAGDEEWNSWKLQHFYDFIKRNNGLTWDERKHTWVEDHGNDILVTRCNHLADAARSKFGVIMDNQDWVHFNGGVFVFDKDSADFMKTWRDFTLSIFRDAYWKTRDQGTLAVTAWKYGIQDLPRLPQEFNFIVSPDNKEAEHRAGLEFSRDHFATVVHPVFIHILTNFGNRNNQVWLDMEKALTGIL